MTMTVTDKLKQLVYEEAGRIQFPTISTCMLCAGVTGCSGGRLRSGWINDKALAVRVALLQHGYHMARWEGKNYLNVKLIPFACTCACAHEWDEVKIGNCLYRVTCRKCGRSTEIDSSG